MYDDASSRSTDVCLAPLLVFRVALLVPTAPCESDTFFCHSNMCINHTLVCNGIQNCVYPWDENHCKGTGRQAEGGRDNVKCCCVVFA